MCQYVRESRAAWTFLLSTPLDAVFLSTPLDALDSVFRHATASASFGRPALSFEEEASAFHYCASVYSFLISGVPPAFSQRASLLPFETPLFFASFPFLHRAPVATRRRLLLYQ